MSAKKGLTMSLTRGVGVCLALALLVSALFASGAFAAKETKPTNYIALGDSVSYGYSQQKFEENFPSESASAFEGGFVNQLGEKLAALSKKSGGVLSTLNLSCPGELSDGLIGTNPLLGGGQQANGVSDSNPCGWHNGFGFPRHVEYGSVSQLEAGIGIVTTPGTYGTAKYATLQIGSNDELAVVKACSTPAYLTLHSFPNGLIECLLHEVSEAGYYYEKGAFFHIIHNIGDTIGVLRSQGFTGEVAVLGFYNPQSQILPGSDTLQKELNAHLGGAIKGGLFGPGVIFVNPFKWTNPTTRGPKAEGVAICKYTEECNVHDKKVNKEKETGLPVTTEEAEKYPSGDIHPTPEGHKLFAKLLYKGIKNSESVE